MNQNEKKHAREFIGRFIDISRSHLTDDETKFLLDLIHGYDSDFRGRSLTHNSSNQGWSSDGKYTRTETTTYTFTPHIGIEEHQTVRYDDGQNDEYRTQITDARGILNWFRKFGRELDR